MSNDDDSHGSSYIDRHVGKRLKLLREVLEYSADDVSCLTGIPTGDLRRYENGTLRISGAMLFRLSSSLQTPMAWFFKDLPVKLETSGARRPQEQVSYEEGLKLVLWGYEQSSPEQREVLISLALSLVKLPADAGKAANNPKGPGPKKSTGRRRHNF